MGKKIQTLLNVARPFAQSAPMLFRPFFGF
jgi:hypothetical protein